MRHSGNLTCVQGANYHAHRPRCSCLTRCDQTWYFCPPGTFWLVNRQSRGAPRTLPCNLPRSGEQLERWVRRAHAKPVVRLQQFQRGFGLGTMMDSTRINLPPAQISGQSVNIHDEMWGTYDQSAQSHALVSHHFKHPGSQDQSGFIQRSPTEEGSPQIRRHVPRSHDDHSTHLVSLSSNVFGCNS